jgi:hypothetical protein
MFISGGLHKAAERASRLGFDLDAVTDQPMLQLLQTGFPAGFEVAHPSSIFRSIGNIDDETNQIVAIQSSVVALVPFDTLRFMAGGAKLIDHLQNRFAQPPGRHFASIIELQREQHLESPPPAAHRLPCL